MTDFNYKKYSLEKLEEWMHDAMSAGEATPQDIYGVIKGVVEENYHHHKHHTSQAYELLALLNGNGKGHIKEYDDHICIDPAGNDLSDVDGLYMTQFYCDSNDSSEECKNSWNSFWEDNLLNSTSAENYIQGGDTVPIQFPGAYGCDTVSFGESYVGQQNMSVDKFSEKFLFEKDKVIKWQLPVEADSSGEYFVNFPDDLLEAAGLKEGDNVEWVDNHNGTYTLRKV